MIDQQVTAKNWEKTRDELDEGAHLYVRFFAFFASMAHTLCSWGNMPAVDVLNLSCNEGDVIREKDISLAFVGASHRRHTLPTADHQDSIR
jgi:hypothetical protein